MATTMTTVDNILKEVYEPRVRDQLQSEMITIRRVEKTSDGVSQDVGGKYVRFAVRVKRNHGVGARNEMEALPVARTQGYETAQVNLTHQYGSVQLSGQTFELAETNPQSFASALDQEVSGMNENLRKDINRQTYGSKRGTLATATGSGTTTTFVTTNTQYLEIGMIVDIFNDSHSLKTDGAEKEITDINGSTVTFSPAADGATATDDYLVRHGSNNKEKHGFHDIIVGNGTGGGALYNITHPVWTSNVETSTGALTEGAMTSMVDTIRKRGGKVTAIFTSMGVRRAYANLLIQQRRYTNTTKFEGGFSGIAFTTDTGDIPVVADWDCPPGHMWFINEPELKLYQSGDWSWMDRDGSKWKQVVTSSGELDAYRATLYKYCELGTHRRNSHGVMTGITEA